MTEATEFLEEEKARLPSLKQTLKQSMYQLAVLLGKPPEALESDFSKKGAIPMTKKQIPLGLPSQLLRRRPDIRRTERTLASSTEQVGVAIAELFPSFSIFGSYGYRTTQNGKWLQPNSRDWRIGPRIDWPILYFGRLRANIHIQTAKQQQALLTYEQTILEALEDVESSLVAYREEEKRLRTIEEKLRAATLRTQLERDRYLSGLIDFSIFLLADQERLRIETEKIASRETLSTNVIALYKSLGGDWPSSSSL